MNILTYIKKKRTESLPKNIPQNKTPGPIGYTIRFYQKEKKLYQF